MAILILSILLNDFNNDKILYSSDRGSILMFCDMCITLYMCVYIYTHMLKKKETTLTLIFIKIEN